MNCPFCRNVIGQPISMVELYNKNKPSKMNRNNTSAYSIVSLLSSMSAHGKTESVV